MERSKPVPEEDDVADAKLQPLEIIEREWRDCQEARDMRLVNYLFI